MEQIKGDSPKSDRHSLNGSNGKRPSASKQSASEMIAAAKQAAVAKRTEAFSEADEVLNEMRSIAPDLADYLKKEGEKIERESISTFRNAYAELEATIARIAVDAEISLDSVTAIESSAELSIAN